MFTGYDILESNISTATSKANKAGVSSNDNFKQIGATKVIPEKYDLITVFDVIYDMVNPKGGLMAINDALGPKSVLLLLEMRYSEQLEENLTPTAPTMYGISIMFLLNPTLSVINFIMIFNLIFLKLLDNALLKK